ncbi:MAG: PIN domain-containing protein [Betaproteobacteria bacterium]|nr:MAG: PIN domain-containing protein [Betaproteobacteria bacterium]
MRLYFDTSALAKAYTSERGSADVDDFLSRGTTVFLSDLNRVELRCMLARRLRSGEISAALEQAMWSQFLLDVSNEFFEPVAVPASAWTSATQLIDRVAPVALRTLDALHVALASTLPSITFVTADRAQRSAAQQLGLPTVGIALD